MLFSKKTKQAQSERRRELRTLADNDFLVEFRRKGSDKMILGYGRDLSSSGVRFTSPVKLKKREELDIVIYFSKNFPGARKASMKARIARIYQPHPTEQNRIGCELLQMDAMSREILRQFLGWLEMAGSSELDLLPRKAI
jgi:hypothetical protein